MVVDRYRSDQHLDAVLPAKAHPRMIVSKRMNDAVVPGHPTYEKFLDCLEGVIGKSPGAFGKHCTSRSRLFLKTLHQSIKNL